MDVHEWSASSRLQLYASKTEMIWFGSRYSLGKLSNAELTLSVKDDVIKPASVVQDLGVLLDTELTMKNHVNCNASSRAQSGKIWK